MLAMVDTRVDCLVKCIFCGVCLPENSLNEHMKCFHKIKTLHLKPHQREVSTQICEEDRHLIYPGKRKLVDMKFLTSTPKKSKLEKSDLSLPIFNGEDSNDECFPKQEPTNYCKEDLVENENIIQRFKCPSCNELSNSCEKMLKHIETFHRDGEQDVRPVRQGMRLLLKKVKMSKHELGRQVDYYRAYGGLYLQTGVRAAYQCVLKSVENMRDITNIKSGCDRNNIHIQDYSEYAFLSLKDFNNEEISSLHNDESEVCIFCEKMLTPGTLEDHIKTEHNINDSLAITTLINMTTESENHEDEILNSDPPERPKTNKFYVNDEIVTEKENDQSTSQPNLPKPVHNQCCSINDSKLNMKFECNWCMKTYNCRYHRNFHENKCNLTLELEKEDPGNADEISLSVFGVRFRCPLCDYYNDNRKDVRDHIVDFHQGYSKRSGQFVELNPIRQEMRILMSRRPMQKVTKKISKPEDGKRKSKAKKQGVMETECIIVQDKDISDHLNNPEMNQTCQLKVNKQLTDEIKAEFNELEKDLGDENSQINEVSIEVNNDVNDEVKDEVQSEINNDNYSTFAEEEPACEIEEITEQPKNGIGELSNTSGIADKFNQSCEDIKEAVVAQTPEADSESNSTESIAEKTNVEDSETSSENVTSECIKESKIKETVEEFDGIILEQVDEKDKSDAELTEKELHYILQSCQLPAGGGGETTDSQDVEHAGDVDDKDAAASLLALLPSWRPWSVSPQGRAEVAENEEGSEVNQVAEVNETTSKMVEITTEMNTEEPTLEIVTEDNRLLDAKLDTNEMTQTSTTTIQEEPIALGEVVAAPQDMLEQKQREKPNTENQKHKADQEQVYSEFEEDNMSVASFHSIRSKVKSKLCENSDSVVSNSEFEEDNMSVASFHSVRNKDKTKAPRIPLNSESDKVVKNTTFDSDPSDFDENVFRSESQSSDCDSSVKMVSPSPARKPPLSDLQNVPGPSRPCQCPFCPTKCDTAKQISAHMAECKRRFKRGDESDDTCSTTTTMAESETSMRPPALDWVVSPRSIKTAKMSDIKSNVTNVYIRFVQTYYSSYKRRFPELSSADLMQKLCEGYRILRATNHQSVRTLQIEYEKERKAKFSDKIRTIVRSLEEDGCAYFNTSLGSGQTYPSNRLTP